MDTKDVNFISFVQTHGLLITPDEWRKPDAEYDDMLKFSNCVHTHIDGLSIQAGREDSIDIVGGAYYTIDNCNLAGNVTIKGAVDGWQMRYTNVGGVIELGQFDNYWYVGRPPTRNGSLYAVYHPDSAAPITVRVWNAEVPHVEDSNVRIVKVSPLIWFPYFCWRWLVVRLTGQKTK